MKNYSLALVEQSSKFFDDVASMLALFRVCLREFKSEKSEPNFEDAKRELDSFIKDKNFPVYVCLDGEEPVGYMVLRIDGVIWVEQIYVKESYRRKGVASFLYQQAEERSTSLGEDTLFNYVHPNNESMIAFLKSKGYTVLNLIEIRKPYKGENPKKVIKVGDHEFDY